MFGSRGGDVTTSAGLALEFRETRHPTSARIW